MELFSARVRVGLGVLLCSVIALVAIAALSSPITSTPRSAPALVMVAQERVIQSTTQDVTQSRSEGQTGQRGVVVRDDEHLLATQFSVAETPEPRSTSTARNGFVQSLERRPNPQAVDRRPDTLVIQGRSESQDIAPVPVAVDVRDEPGGWCDGDWEAQICEVAYVAIEQSGRDPMDPHPGQLSRCGVGRGCLSNLGAVMRLLNCESNLDPNAYAEGYVQGTWNESRGIAQIGNGWGHIATDEQAFDWRWSVRHVSSDPYLVTERLYPECGIAVDADWKARLPQAYR